MLNFLAFATERLSELWIRTAEHLMMTCISTVSAIAVGVPIGILLFRRGWLRNPVLAVIGIFQTIPSLAMLAILLALFSKIGLLPALIALIIYALLPIVRNTLAGLLGVPADVVEAAMGIGMTPVQELRLVRIPLATPVIVAGVRTAAVVGVGIATLSAFIGAGGLGQFINRGLALSSTNLILLGAVPAAILALLVDFSIGAVEWALRPASRRYPKNSFKAWCRKISFVIPLVFLAAGAAPFLTETGSKGDSGIGGSGKDCETVRVGAKNFTEQILLGEIMAQCIERQTGLRVERRFNLGGTMICHGAIVNNEIDIYAEYTGTGLTAVLKRPAMTDPNAVYDAVSRAYENEFGLTWLGSFGFNNTYTITVRRSVAEQNGWTKISDLARDARMLKAGFTSEFAERPDGYPGLREAYGLFFGRVVDLDPSLMYEAIAGGEVDVICAFSTDGRISAYDLLPLSDDRRFFPPYVAAPVVRSDFLSSCPEVGKALAGLAGNIDDAAMQRLNYEVNGKGRSPAEVASRFLKSLRNN